MVSREAKPQLPEIPKPGAPDPAQRSGSGGGYKDGDRGHQQRNPAPVPSHFFGNRFPLEKPQRQPLGKDQPSRIKVRVHGSAAEHNDGNAVSARWKFQALQEKQAGTCAEQHHQGITACLLGIPHVIRMDR